MPKVYCVRANYGAYTKQFIAGGYAAIGWLKDDNLSSVHGRDELTNLYKAANPTETSNNVIGQQVGQIARFLLEIQPGDFIITPDPYPEKLWYGTVAPSPSYFVGSASDGCPYLHRRRVQWSATPIRRYGLSVPLQSTLRSSLTVFEVSQRDEFFRVIGKNDLVSVPAKAAYDAYKVVIEQIRGLTATEFEILIKHLLTALGFEESQHVGGPGDQGVDVKGVLNAGNLARVQVLVQAKRYDPATRIDAKTVKQLRQSIPSGGQGAFITTSDYAAAAHEIAFEQGFPRIGLVNGRQLVDLLVEHWEDIPPEFQNQLGLKPGLVKV
jgi:predicted Mrr-cat superfamily restriction endonuclease